MPQDLLPNAVPAACPRVVRCRVLAALAADGGLAGCATGTGTASPPAAPTPPVRPTGAVALPYDGPILPTPDTSGFLESVREQLRGAPAADVPDDAFLALGDNLCIVARSGLPLDDVAERAEELGVPAAAAPAVLQAAVAELCPDAER